jgi:hypothetical protein
MAPAMADHKVFLWAPKVLMIRDPRDAASSHFFFAAYSHSLPEFGDPQEGPTETLLNLRKSALASSIDEFVLSNSRNLGHAMLSCSGVAVSSTTRVFRYEECIFRKRDLIRELSGWLDLPLEDDIRPAITATSSGGKP